MISADNVELVLDISSSCWDDLPPCTEDSYYSEYTECVGGTRSLIYQKKPEANCNGGVSLPSPQTGFPCAMSCPMGQYASQRGVCTPCGLGHYSLGSAVREDAWQSWDNLNIPFTTYCTELDQYKVEHQLNGVECGWVLGGYEINSGALNNSQAAYLETSVVLIEDGQFIFDFRVDAEPKYDGLTVYVDREVVLDKQSSVFDYSLKVVNLTAGYHFIQFVYSKDQSVSQGADAAAINIVQFSPVAYAADECSSCRPGRFQNQTGKSFCYDCPANTYSSDAGSYHCSKCSPGYYSFEGSSSCTQQPPCTIDDVYYLYDKCYYSNGQLVQNLYPLWNTPHICDDSSPVPPYQNYTQSCIHCNPGEYRKGTECAYCADGYASSTGESCTLCPAGTQAIKALYIDHFDFWDQGLSTDCSYFCGSPGWELHDDYIDSGSGHGRYVNSNLYLDATLPVSGFIYFSYEINCTQSCELEFQYTNGTGGNYRGGPGINPLKSTAKFAVIEGDIHFRWIFTKNDPDGIGRLDYARIDSIIIANVADGGATNCTDCKAGYYADRAGSTTCTQCPAGTYSSSGAAGCTTCATGYFNPSAGASQCIQCGEGTQSNDDHTDCIVTCDYKYNNEEYDLSPMARTDDEMYGPVYDVKNQIYYLNVCNREHNNHTCIDAQDQPIDTFACQVTTLGYGVDLGDVFGFMPLRNSEYYEEGGVTVHLTNGEPCKNSTNGQSYARQTYIDVICDPSAGIGSPIAFDTDDNIVETSKCVYEFTWNSLYGCHVCTVDDYTYIISDCNSEEKRYIQYQWLDNPKSCHGGVSLPETIEISCNNPNSLYCPPGSYLDLSTLPPVCATAEAGFYSIGGGESYNTWTDLAEGFSSMGWAVSSTGQSIESSSGNTSLLYLREFVEIGHIDITYRIFGYEATGGFSVYVDEVLAMGPIQTTEGVYITQSIAIDQIGSHFIKFEFAGGEEKTSGGGGIGVEVKEITVIGIYHASEFQLPCPGGTYSSAGATECTPCPMNTYSHSAASVCSSCPKSYYSFVGSTGCTKKQVCELADYQQTYTDCQFGVRYEVYVPLTPFICNNSTFQTPNITEIACDAFDCEPGEYRKDSLQCDVCDSGYYYDDSKKKCEQSSAGYAGILKTGFYHQPEPSLPDQFTTGCVGNCIDPTYGWRSRSTYLDSGSNEHREVDVYLDLTITLLYVGKIQFTYEISGDHSNGVYLFVNEKQEAIPYHPSSSTTASISLNKGETTIRWVYHQEKGKEGVVTIHDILITGVGGATSQVVCPAGTFANTTGLNACYPCPAGSFSSSPASVECSSCSFDTFAEFESSSSCKSCGDLTFSNDDHTDCITNCLFDVKTSYGDRQIDLSPLSTITGPFALDSTTDKLWLNVCAKKSSPLICIDSFTGESINTYSCQVDSTGRGYDSGRLLSVDIINDQQIQMIYSDGDITEGCTSPITTQLLISCSVGNDLTIPYETEDSTPCNLRLQWDISYACPLCKEEDYENKTSECVNGKQTVALVRMRDCYGPDIRDANDDVDCSNPMSVSLIILIAVCIVVVILVAAIAVIVYFNWKIQKKYAALVQKDNGSYEMSDLPDDNSLLDDDDA